MATSERQIDRFDSSSQMGTRKWWDYQIAHNWEINGGPAQTSYFMKVLIDHLSPSEQSYLRANSPSILDCGCATGEGVAILGQTFPVCRVAGLDVAQSAIEAAQARYPQHEFILSEEGEIPRPFDVIVTSNVLEHFADPLAMARQQAANSRLLYIVLVPYLEYPLIEGHVITFTENSFPIFLSGLVRLSITSFEADPEVWHGKQILAVYASQAYIQERPREDNALIPEQEWEAYFQAPAQSQALIDSLAARCAQAETSAVLGRLQNSALLAEKIEKIERLRERWAPRGTWRRKLLNHFVAGMFSKA